MKEVVGILTIMSDQIQVVLYKLIHEIFKNKGYSIKKEHLHGIV